MVIVCLDSLRSRILVTKQYQVQQSMPNNNRLMSISTPSRVHVSRAVLSTLQLSLLLPVHGWAEAVIIQSVHVTIIIIIKTILATYGCKQNNIIIRTHTVHNCLWYKTQLFSLKLRIYIAKLCSSQQQFVATGTYVIQRLTG